MKLVVDNPTHVPAKRVNKAHGVSPFLISKLNGEGGAKISVVRRFQRFLESGVHERVGNIDKGSKEVEELQPTESVERNYLDTFGNLFDDLERKYERDLKETTPSELQESDEASEQAMKLIDARVLFSNLRLDREVSGSGPVGKSDDTASSIKMSRPGNVETLVAILPLSTESGATMGADKQQCLVPEAPQAGIVIPQEVSRIEKQRPVVNFPTNNTDSHDRDAPPKVTAVHGKTVESNSSFEVSAIRLEAPLGLAVTPGPVHQVIERVTKMLPAQNMEFRHLPDGQKTVRFALQPESLGDVSIVLRLRDSGADLAIRPQRREAAQFLENSRDELLQALKLTGVEMRTVEISSLDTTAGQDMKQDRFGANQGGGHTSQFQSPQSGSSFHGGGRENQWRTPETIAARKGNKDETEKPKMGDPAIGRGIVV